MYEFFLRNELPSLLEDFPFTVRVMYFQHDRAALHYTWYVTVFAQIFPWPLFRLWGPLVWLSRS